MSATSNPSSRSPNFKTPRLKNANYSETSIYIVLKCYASFKVTDWGTRETLRQIEFIHIYERCEKPYQAIL